MRHVSHQKFGAGNLADLSALWMNGLFVRRPPRSKLLIPAALSLFAITAAVFWPACDNGFVNWDDHSYVVSQPGVLAGLSWRGLQWAATAKVAGNWHPLTLFSLQADAQLFGTSPRGFHRTSVLLHAANASLALLAVYSLTGHIWKSAIVAALFALHPMRVESVAWVSERKDVLSGFFFLISLLAYSSYARRRSRGRYLLVLLWLGLGLMSKAMLVTTPCVFLLLDYWPLQGVHDRTGNDSPPIGRLLLEKLPFLSLSLMSSIVIIACQESAYDSIEHLPLLKRVENGATSAVVYLLKTVWPSGLSPFYGFREITVMQFVGALALLMAITGFAIGQRIRRPYLLVGWLWFLGMLVPVIGLVQVGTQARADRYTYLPHIGLFIMLVWGMSDLIIRLPRGRFVSILLVAVGVSGCTVITIRQIPVWRDTESLWRRAYSLDPDEPLVIQPNLIRCLLYKGKNEEALQLTLDSIRTADGSAGGVIPAGRSIVWLAMLLAVQGEHQRCVDALDLALKHEPRRPDTYAYRGKEFAAMGKWQEAAEAFRQAMELAPRAPSYRFYLAHALGKIGRQDEARPIYASALRSAPRWPGEAMSESWRKSTSSDPLERLDVWPVCLAEQVIEATAQSEPLVLDVLAAAYANSGRFAEACATATRAIELAESDNQPAMAAGVRKRLELYERGRPYRRGGVEWNPIP